MRRVSHDAMAAVGSAFHFLRDLRPLGDDGALHVAVLRADQPVRRP